MKRRNRILDGIRSSAGKEKDNTARNSMGVLEKNYNSYYLIGQCFEFGQIEEMTIDELDNLIKLADFATEVFY